MRKILIVFIILQLLLCTIGLRQIVIGYYYIGLFNLVINFVMILFNLNTLKKWES